MVILVLVMYILYRHLSGEADALKLSFLSLPVFLTLRYGILFFLGSAFYLFKEKIILKPFTFILALIILCNYKDDLAIFIALPYIVAYIALAVNNKVLRNWGKFGDFSYGLYVFAFPVQQLIMHYLGNKISLPVFFITSYLVTLSIAVISWNLIEKPAMRLKKVDLLGFLSIVYSKILKFILMGKNQVKEI
jgi:peptidoglycan/LPS O-acetylase OafA/YrhL